MSGSSYAAEAGRPGGGQDVTGILFVCTANQCRSVLAEAIARRRFADAPFVFASAGLLAGGRAMPDNGIQVAREWGFDLATHVSRRVDATDLRRWDVVVTMARQHVRELVAADAELWPRVFTLRQFSRWLDVHPPHRHVRLDGWIDQEGADRPRSDMIGASVDDDIVDPVNEPPEAWRDLMGELNREIDHLARRLAPGLQDRLAPLPGRRALRDTATTRSTP